jgi:hypothetical protein
MATDAKGLVTVDSTGDLQSVTGTAVGASHGLDVNVISGSITPVGTQDVNIVTPIGQKAMAASVPVVVASNQSAIPISGSVSVSNFPATQPVSAVSLPLPTGAATETTLSAVNIKLPAALGQTTMSASLAVVVASDQSAVPISGSVSVSNFPATQPVSGTVAATQSGTWNINNVSGTVSLPTGASTETTLAAASAKLPATLGQKVMTASLAVVVASDQSAVPVSGSVSATQSGTWTVQPGNTANTTAWKVDGSAVTQPISASALPLPSGAATSGNQSTIITSLSSIDAGIPAGLGQTTMSASMPVTIASDQSQVGVNFSSSSFLATQASIATSATQVLASPLANRRSISVANTDASNRVWIGTSNGVLTTTGYVVEPKTTLSLPFNASVTSIYMIASTAAVTVCLMELT